jgi:transcriptional regulator with XRE-family HTH domain
METTNFYGTITRLCTQKGISITALGNELKLSKATTSGWKKGAQPQARTLKALADYFKVSVDQLMETENTPVSGKLKIWKETILFSVEENPVVLQELTKGGEVEYCVQYAGGGKYFLRLEKVAEYLNERWSANLDAARLLEILEVVPVLDTEVGKPAYKNYANNIHNSNLVQGDSVLVGSQANGKPRERTLSNQEAQLLRIFAELTFVEQARVVVYAAELKDKK